MTTNKVSKDTIIHISVDIRDRMRVRMKKTDDYNSILNRMLIAYDKFYYNTINELEQKTFDHKNNVKDTKNNDGTLTEKQLLEIGDKVVNDFIRN